MTRSLRQLTTSAVALVVCVGMGPLGHAQSIHHDTGQDVAPAFEGWERNSDGSSTFVFGYLNRNYEEQVDLPVGPANTFEPGPPDRGQPTHFYPRRQRFIFRVPVPKDWDKNRKLVWTLTSHGHTNQAKAWLQPEWELSPNVLSENNNGGVLAEGNIPPTLTLTASAQTVTLPNALSLTATATDDWLPKPKPRKPEVAAAAAAAPVAAPVAAANPDAPVRRPEGLSIKWIHYRGPGTVTFDSPSTSPEYGKPLTRTTTVRFTAPGTYILRAVASDGQLETTQEVTVAVQ